MIIIKKSKLKKLKACKRACKRIYEAMNEAPDDEHGNASPYRWDKTHKEILEALEEAGYGAEHHNNIVGFDSWTPPWDSLNVRCAKS